MDLNSRSPRLKRLHQRVTDVKNSDSSEVRYMQLWEEKAIERLEGREEGKAEGLETGIRALILDNLEEGISEERILEKLRKRFGLSHEAAALYLSKVHLL